VFTRGQGDRNAQAGWIEGERLVLDWGPSDPFHYDKFIVRWDKDGRNVGQVDQNGGNRGRWSTVAEEAGVYKVIVEGTTSRPCRVLSAARAGRNRSS
jgi:hypothetical protein